MAINKAPVEGENGLYSAMDGVEGTSRVESGTERAMHNAMAGMQSNNALAGSPPYNKSPFSTCDLYTAMLDNDKTT